MDLKEVKALVDKQGIEFFLCSFVEMAGVPKAKLVPVPHLDIMAAEGAGFAGFAAGDIGQLPHDSDMFSIPDFDSLTIVPWRPNMAWVAGNVHVDGKAWPYCPRTILINQLAKAADKGYTLKLGVEAEFMLLKQDELGNFLPWDALDTLGKPCYDLRALHRNLDMMTRLIKYMQDLDWYPYANDHGERRRGRGRNVPRHDRAGRRGGKVPTEERRPGGRLLWQAFVLDRQRAAQRRELLPRHDQRLHVQPDVSRGELEHLSPPRRVLDDRAGAGVLRHRGQHEPS